MLMIIDINHLVQVCRAETKRELVLFCLSVINICFL